MHKLFYIIYIYEMKWNKFFWAILSFMSVLYIWTWLLIYRNLHPSIIWEEITCEYRYIGWEYRWTVLAKKWDYIYLSWVSEVWLDCTISEEEVTEDMPLCWTYTSFSWPLDISNMNCYKWDDDIEWKLKAFKKQEEDAKAEDKKYYTCDLRADEMVDIYNSCETRECATYRIREYLKSTCPSATIK